MHRAQWIFRRANGLFTSGGVAEAAENDAHTASPTHDARRNIARFRDSLRVHFKGSSHRTCGARRSMGDTTDTCAILDEPGAGSRTRDVSTSLQSQDCHGNSAGGSGESSRHGRSNLPKLRQRRPTPYPHAIKSAVQMERQAISALSAYGDQRTAIDGGGQGYNAMINTHDSFSNLPDDFAQLLRDLSDEDEPDPAYGSREHALSKLTGQAPQAVSDPLFTLPGNTCQGFPYKAMPLIKKNAGTHANATRRLSLIERASQLFSRQESNLSTSRSFSMPNARDDGQGTHVCTKRKLASGKNTGPENFGQQRVPAEIKTCEERRNFADEPVSPKTTIQKPADFPPTAPSHNTFAKSLDEGSQSFHRRDHRVATAPKTSATSESSHPKKDSTAQAEGARKSTLSRKESGMAEQPEVVNKTLPSPFSTSPKLRLDTKTTENEFAGQYNENHARMSGYEAAKADESVTEAVVEKFGRRGSVTSTVSLMGLWSGELGTMALLIIDALESGKL